MKLSIIVPVYKVEPYLRRCVDSILAQTFRDFEVILVDDGSPYNCGVVCDEYAAKDERVKVIHKANGGISSARNAGLDIAQGDYIGFVDSDDYIAPDMYETLLELSERTIADISAVGFTEVAETGDVIRRWEGLAADRVYKRKDFICGFFPDYFWKIMPNVWNKIFRKTLFESIRFPVNRIYEDACIQLPLYDLCESIAVSERYCYFYTIREGSIMRSSFSEKICR